MVDWSVICFWVRFEIKVSFQCVHIIKNIDKSFTCVGIFLKCWYKRVWPPSYHLTRGTTDGAHNISSCSDFLKLYFVLISLIHVKHIFIFWILTWYGIAKLWHLVTKLRNRNLYDCLLNFLVGRLLKNLNLLLLSCHE